MDTCDELKRMSDDEILALLKDLLQHDFQTRLRLALVVEELSCRGIAIPILSPATRRLLSAIRRGVITAEIYEAFNGDAHWLNLFAGYRDGMRDRVLSGGKFDVAVVDGPRVIKCSARFNDMSDEQRMQVFGRGAPRDFEQQMLWRDARQSRLDEAARKLGRNIRVDKQFEFESECAAKRFQKLSSETIVSLVAQAGLLDRKRRGAGTGDRSG